MDPNANLEEQRRIVARLLSPEPGVRDLCDPAFTPPPPKADDVLRLAELVQALDEWIKGGGFLPKDWQKE